MNLGKKFTQFKFGASSSINELGEFNEEKMVRKLQLITGNG